MEKYWQVSTEEDGLISDYLESYQEALDYAKELAKSDDCDDIPVDIYECRKIATVERGPVIVTKHKK